jgi:flagellar hook-associated protein 1 FlgK
MGGLFGNLNQASKALMANQVAIQITGRNLANVNNPLYARQRAIMGDKYVEQTPSGPQGSGVEVLQVQQLRDAFLDSQVIRQSSDTGSLAAQKAILSNLELVLGGQLSSASSPSSVTDTVNSATGIGTALDNFFNSFAALAANPADIPSRSAALVAAQTLADRINQVDQNLASSQVDQEQQIVADVKTANNLLADIAQLNGEIRKVDDGNGGASDLIDQRQAKLEQLAGLIKVDITKDSSNPNETNLSISGVQLVAQGQLVHQIGYLTQASAATLSSAGTLGARTQGFEVGDYDPSGTFTPTAVSNGGASMLSIGDSISGTGIPSGTTVTAKLDGSSIQLSKSVSSTGYNGYVSLAVNGVSDARMGFINDGSKIVTLSNTVGYAIVPTGGSVAGRYQAIFGNPTATYMTAQGLRTQIADLSAQLKTQVNTIYNPTGASSTDFFQNTDVPLSGGATVAGSRNVTVSNTAGVSVGMHVSGTGIPSGATVAKVLDDSRFTLSIPATSTASGSTLAASRDLLAVRGDLTASTLSTSATTAAGANAIVSKIAALRDASFTWSSPISGGAAFTAKFGDYNRNVITSLAQTIQSVSTRFDESDVVATAVKNQRDSVSGVSLDEETADLLRFQKAYQANAQVITVIDEMLSSLISMIR